MKITLLKTLLFMFMNIYFRIEKNVKNEWIKRGNFDLQGVIMISNNFYYEKSLWKYSSLFKLYSFKMLKRGIQQEFKVKRGNFDHLGVTVVIASL